MNRTSLWYLAIEEEICLVSTRLAASSLSAMTVNHWFNSGHETCLANKLCFAAANA